MLNFIKKIVFGFIFKQIILGAIFGILFGFCFLYLIACYTSRSFNGIDLLMRACYTAPSFTITYFVVMAVCGIIAKILPW